MAIWAKGLGGLPVAFARPIIGIEIASEGGFTKHEGKLSLFDRVHEWTCSCHTNVFDYGKYFREYRYFARYKKAQVDAVIHLVNHLSDRLAFSRFIPMNYLAYLGDDLKNT